MKKNKYKKQRSCFPLGALYIKWGEDGTILLGA
jgi:hypothetical protein